MQLHAGTVKEKGFPFAVGKAKPPAIQPRKIGAFRPDQRDRVLLRKRLRQCIIIAAQIGERRLWLRRLPERSGCRIRSHSTPHIPLPEAGWGMTMFGRLQSRRIKGFGERKAGEVLCARSSEREERGYGGDR